MRLLIALLTLFSIPTVLATPVLPNCEGLDFDPTLYPKVLIPYWCHIVDDADPIPGTHNPPVLESTISASPLASVILNPTDGREINPQPQQPPAPRREAPSNLRKSRHR